MLQKIKFLWLIYFLKSIHICQKPKEEKTIHENSNIALAPLKN